MEKRKKYSAITLKYAEEEIAKGHDLDPELFPELFNLSAAFFYKFVPYPTKRKNPEFVYIPLDFKKGNREEMIKREVLIAQWNTIWEAGHLRADFFEKDIPPELSWLRNYNRKNIYLLPDAKVPRYETYKPLFHLLPQGVLRKFNLPILKKGVWPPLTYQHLIEPLLMSNFEEQLSKAFSFYIWPLLNSSSKMQAFAKNDPLITLSHNLDYWLPFIYTVAEERLKTFGRTESESEEAKTKLIELRKTIPRSIKANTPLKGGAIWMGEQEAWHAASDMVNIADRDGKLRSLIDAIKSNRIEDDFSSLWSFEREDFERKLYQKRSKVKVSFVELNDTIPVHGRWSELHEDLLWQDFISILDQKERRVVICLRSGITKMTDIGKLMGYANHSPISKVLKTIRLKAAKYLF
jgi:hypothetical protein